MSSAGKIPRLAGREKSPVAAGCAGFPAPKAAAGYGTPLYGTTVLPMVEAVTVIGVAAWFEIWG